MNNAKYIASSTAAKIAYAALAFATVASFATAMGASEHSTVVATQVSQLEVRVAEPVVVTAKRDVRRLAAMEVVGHRSDVVVAAGGMLSSNKLVASPAL